jgi:hypothetical protein
MLTGSTAPAFFFLSRKNERLQDERLDSAAGGF